MGRGIEGEGWSYPERPFALIVILILIVILKTPEITHLSIYHSETVMNLNQNTQSVWVAPHASFFLYQHQPGHAEHLITEPLKLPPPSPEIVTLRACRQKRDWCLIAP